MKPGYFDDFPINDHYAEGEQPPKPEVRFRERITKRTKEVIEALPEKIGMHFTQAGKAKQILQEGLHTEASAGNFAYTFEKDHEYRDLTPEKRERLKLAGLEGEIFDALENLKRFHQTFELGLAKYGSESLPPKTPEQSWEDWLKQNLDSLPAVALLDLSNTTLSQINRGADVLKTGNFADLPKKRYYSNHLN